MSLISRNTPTFSKPEVRRQHLGQAADGGLHFDGAAGNIDIASPPDLGAKFSFEFIVKADEWGSNAGYLLDFSNGGRFIFGTTSSQSYNISIYDNSNWVNFGVKVLDDLKVHHLVCTVDGTAATLFDNGVSVGTATISASHGIDSCSDLTIGPGATGTPLTLSRTRFYNRTLSGAEVKEKFENQNLEFSEQWGSQTSKILNGTAWTGASGTTAPNSWTTGNQGTYTIDSSSGSGSEPALKIARSIDNPYIHQNFTAVIGAKYRISYKVKNIDATQANVGIGNTAIGSQYYLLGYSSTDWQTVNLEITATTSLISVYLQAITSTGTQAVYFDSVEIKQIGAVTDFCLSEASPSASLMLADRSTNSVDGTISSSGVTAIAKPIQINAVAARIGSGAVTPSDNELIAGKLTVGDSSTNELLVGFESSSQDFGIGANGANFMIGTSATDLDTGNLVSITSAGIVGIGDATPDAEGLEIAKASADTSFNLNSQSDNLLVLRNSDEGSTNNGRFAGLQMKINCAAPFSAAEGTIRTEYTGNGNSSLILSTTAAGSGADHLSIDSSGRVIIGAGAMPLKWWNGSTYGAKFLVENNGSTAPADYVTAGVVRNTNDGEAPQLGFAKSRGTTTGAVTVLQSGDPLGTMTFQGADGTNYVEAARINAIVDGTPGADDMPGRLQFSTTADGAASPTVRMTIDSAGLVTVGNQVKVTSSNASTVAFSVGDAGTGFYNTGSNAIGLATNGVQRLNVNSSGAVQVLSDGGNNNPAHLSLWAKDTSIAGGDVIGSLLGQGSDSATSPPLTGAKINFTADHAWDGSSANYQSTRIDFFTQNNTGTDTLDLPRMSIANNGVVTIKRKTAGNGTGANTVLTLGIDDLPAGTDMAAGDGTRLLFKIPAADTNKVGASIDAIRAVATDADSSTDLRFMVSQNDETLDTAMTINSAGDVSVGAGNSKEATIQSTNSGRVEGNPAYSFRGDLDTGMFNPNTDNTLAFSTGGTERMRIASNGEIYMGSSSQGVSIHGNTTGEGIITGINAAKDTYKKLTLNASEFDFKISGTSKATISSAGLATFANGIAFSQTNTSATGATATSTTLNHFESGTWTPVFKGGSSAGSYSAGTTVARYTRIGNVVSVLCSLINITESSAGSGSIEISGLPFTSANISTQATGTGSVRLRSYTSSGSAVMAYVADNSASVLFSQYVSGSADSHLSITGLSSGSSDLTFSLTYFV